MNFIIDCAELALFAAETETVKVTTSLQQVEASYCQNCRDSCDSWCTALCASSSTK